MRTRLVIIFIILILFLTVIAQNTEVVTIRAFFWTLSMSRIVLLSVALLIGVLIGILLARPWRRRKPKREASRPAPSEGTD
ncbi:MAG TPA: LapA family protein [Candidatus Acetothermia bacterium]|nr:LapA family protein [Candidatus Acetothermia bacterium]